MMIVAVDIGSFSVKVVELHAAGKSYAFQKFHEVFLSSDPNKDKKIEVLDILRKLSEQYDPETTKFVFAVPQSQISVRQRTFPFRERYKILRAIAFELEDDIPFSQDEAVFEAKITRFQQNNSSVLACAVPKTSVKDVLSLAKEAGLEPHLISAEGLAFGNLVEKWDQPPPEEPLIPETPEARATDLLIHIGHNRTLISAFQDGAMLLSRSFDFGGRHLAEAIAEKYKILYLEALKELQKKAFVLLSNEGATSEQIAFSDQLKKAFEPLIQDVKLTILELQSQQLIRIASIRISGGPSQIQNLGAFLTQAWEAPVNRLKVLEGHSWTNIELTPHIAAVAPMGFALAIEGARRPRNPAINLMRGEFEPRSETFTQLWNKWGYAVQLSAICLAVFLVYGVVREHLAIQANDQLTEVLRKHAGTIANLQGRQASPRNVRRFVKEKKSDAVNRASAEEVKSLNSALDVVAELSRRTPQRQAMPVVIRRLKITNEEVEIQGDLPQSSPLDPWKKILESLATGGKVSPASSTQPPIPGRKAFAFRFQTERR